MRLWLIALLCAAFGADAVAQDNPNSPRARREMRLLQQQYQQPQPGQLSDTVEPSRWGTMSNPVPRPQWGTQGSTGWPGAASPPR